MRKRLPYRLTLLLVASVLAFAQPLASAPLDTVSARKAATNFYNWRTARSLTYEYAHLVHIQQTEPQGTDLQTAPVDALYVFDFGDGFVMLSADTRIRPVLGYSTESGFNSENIPSQLLWLMEEYTREIGAVVESVSDGESVETADEWSLWLSGDTPVMAAVANVGPLLQTLWDQNSPYNSQCPSASNGPGGHVYAGCVACAMAQIIRYWQYPSSGIGSHSYSANFSSQGYGNYGTQSVNFATATYDFSQMPLTLNSNSPAAQINEVAKLMYHCGVAVDMRYGPYGSGAYDNDALNALQTYFGYTGIMLKYKSNYSESEWLALIKGELNNLRPVIYSGQGSGGHSFVCDGYDSQDLLHFNWGWSGSYNGYYTVSNLNPGSHNFSNSQLAIIGIDASQPMIHAASESLSFLTEEGSVSDSKSVPVLGANLSNPISASITGNFQISTDNANFQTTLSLNSQGGILYLRYNPTVSSGTESGLLVLTSGNVTDTIFLSGTVYDPYPHCIPPENLTISSQNLHDVTVHWETPVMAPDPHTLTWSSTAAYTSFGYGSDYQRSMLQRFCDTDLVACHNQALTSIRFYAKSGVTTYKAVVYKGGSYNGGFDPGTLVLSQDINLNSLTMNAWNTVTLNTPVVVDASQELWFGIYLEAPGGSFCIPLNPQYKAKKGCICGTHTSGSVSWSEFNNSNSFCIQGTVENVQTVTDYQVSRDGTAIGTTASTSIQDHLINTDTYTYTVTANWSNGCSASAQRSFTNVAQIIVSPESLDFFANYGYGTLVKKVIVSSIGITSSIAATVTGNFLISSDSITFSTNLTLPYSGGTLYVKYAPSSQTAEYETGLLTFVSGSLGTTVPLSGQCHAECNPPQNLTVTNSGNLVSLGWDAPDTQAIQQRELTWSNSLYGTAGASSEIKRFTVQRFDVADLAPYHGQRLTAVSFVPSAYATAYRIVVFQGGGLNGSIYLTSGTQVTDQSVSLSSLTIGVWNTITLNDPVTVI